MKKKSTTADNEKSEWKLEAIYSKQVNQDIDEEDSIIKEIYYVINLLKNFEGKLNIENYKLALKHLRRANIRIDTIRKEYRDFITDKERN